MLGLPIGYLNFVHIFAVTNLLIVPIYNGTYDLSYR